MASELHSIPCKIKYTGPANVSAYFHLNREQMEKGTEIASFRGNLLNGCQIQPHDGYSVYVVDTKATNKTDSDDDDDEGSNDTQQCAEKRLKVCGEVEKVMYWNFDCETSKKDPITKAVSWIKISELLANEDDE